MDRDRWTSTVVPIVMSAICIVLAMNVLGINWQLNAEKAYSTELSSQILDLAGRVSLMKAECERQKMIVRDLQGELDAVRIEREAAKREREAAKREAEALRRSDSGFDAQVGPTFSALQELSESAEVDVE